MKLLPVKERKRLLRLADELGWLAYDGPLELDGITRDAIGELRHLLLGVDDRG